MTRSCGERFTREEFVAATPIIVADTKICRSKPTFEGTRVTVTDVERGLA